MLPISRTYGFPSEYVPREKKETKEYGMQVAQAIYSRWYNASPISFMGFNNTGYANMSYFRTLRQYAEGRQDAEQYKLMYRGANTGANNSGATSANNVNNPNARKGYNNISFEVESYAPVMVSTIKGILTSSDWKVQVESTSKADIKTKSKMKWKLYTESQIGNPLRQSVGLQPTKRDWFPQTKAELELYEKYHGFRLPLEVGLSKIAEHGFDISHWNTLRDQIIDSALQTSFLVGRVCHNHNGAAHAEYIDPANFVTSFYDPKRDQEPVFAGHITKVKLDDIADKLIEQGATQKDLENLARKYAPYNIMGDVTSYNYTSRDPVTSRYMWYDFQVDVLHFEWKTDDKKLFVGRKTKNDVYVYKQEDKVKKQYADGRERKTDEYYEQSLYKGTWIIGTNWIIDYGLAENVMRTPDGCVATSYVIERIPQKSFVERWKPLLDQQMMATLKFRAAVQAAAPKGLAIDIGLLANMDFGFGKLTGVEIARLRKETGNFFYATSAAMQAAGRTGASALAELDNGIGKQLEEWITYLRWVETQLRATVGLTETASATPNGTPDKLVGLGQLELDATNNALYSIRNAVIKFKEKMAYKLVAKARILIEADKKSASYYEDYLGSIYYKAVKDIEDLTLNGIGIKLKSTPTVQQVQEIMMLVAESLKAGKNGMIGINTADALLVSNTLRDGEIELAQWYLELAEERARVKNKEAQMRMSEQNGQIQIQSAQAATESKAQLEQVLANLRMQENTKEIADKLEAELAKEEVLHQYRMKELSLEGSIQASTGRDVKGRI